MIADNHECRRVMLKTKVLGQLPSIFIAQRTLDREGLPFMALFDPVPIDPLQLHSESGPTPAKKSDGNGVAVRQEGLMISTGRPGLFFCRTVR